MLFRPPSNGIEHPGEIIDYNNYYGQRGYVSPQTLYRDRIIVPPRTEVMFPLMIGIIVGVITCLCLWYFLNHLAHQEPVLDNPLSQERQQLREQELQILFSQKRIDPLTRYLAQHEGDNTRTSYVSRVKTERVRRCAEIERLYQKSPKNYQILAKLTKGYNYSCPGVVTRFVQNI